MSQKSPYNQALDILSRRDHSKHELRQKLAKKGVTSRLIDEVIEKLEQNHLVDDAKCARSLVTSTLRSKAVGPRWLADKLRQRGIDQVIASDAIDEAMAQRDEHTLALEAYQQWQKVNPKKASDNERATRFLQSRGFNLDAIAAALNQESAS